MLTSLHKNPFAILVITTFTLICVSFSYSEPYDVRHSHPGGTDYHTHIDAAELWIDTDGDGNVDTRVDDLTDEQREDLIGPDCNQKLNKDEMKSVLVNYLEPLEEEDLDEGYVDTLDNNEKAELRRILDMSRNALNSMNADGLADLVLAGFPSGFDRQDLEDTSKVNFIRSLATGTREAQITIPEGDQCPNPLIEIVYTDSFHNSHAEPATVYNDAPVFTDGGSTTRSIDENTGSDEAIGDPVSATDPENDKLTYTLGGTDVSSFSIDSGSGQLLTSVALDYETKSSYTVTVTVSDGILTDTITVTISITDANDAPVFTEGDSTTRSIDENTRPNEAIGLPVSATDPDNDELNYVLKSAVPFSGFLIVSTSGQLLTPPLNHEAQSTYTVIIEVSDGKGGTDTITVTISVTDVNEAPVFSETNITRSIVIDGDTAVGASIGAPVSATDPENDVLTYTLSGTDASFFSIDSTGQLQATDTFINDAGDTYSVTVTATDSRGESANVNVTVNATRTSEGTQQNEGTQQQKAVSPPPQMEIGDSNLAAVIRETLGLDADAEITDTDMAALTELDASEREISDLTGLEHATNLTELDLRDNEITDIGALSDLTGLTFLHLGGNSISDLSALSDLTGLTHLYLGRNSISDLSALSGLTNLTHFSLARGDVTDISALSGLTNLVRLYLERNTISDLTPLTDLTDLKYLYLNRNNISDVSPLARLVNLEILRLSNNPILDTSPLYSRLEANGGKLSDVNITITEYPPWDVNEDGVVDATDSARVTAALGQSGNDIVNPRTDVNGDATVDADDLTLVTENLDAGNAAPSSREVFTLLDRATLETLAPDTLAAQLASLRAKSDGSLKYQRAIALLESVLAALHPDKTKLLANYPNPFNPETWIPYQLARGSNVWITIYDTRGAVVRRLELGYRAEGYYRVRGRAAHWEGRNTVGERVASGLYFYQLETDNVSLLRKMVILK